MDDKTKTATDFIRELMVAVICIKGIIPKNIPLYEQEYLNLEKSITNADNFLVSQSSQEIMEITKEKLDELLHLQFQKLYSETKPGQTYPVFPDKWVVDFISSLISPLNPKDVKNRFDEHVGNLIDQKTKEIVWNFFASLRTPILWKDNSSTSPTECVHPWASVMGDGEMSPAKCLKCGKQL